MSRRPVGCSARAAGAVFAVLGMALSGVAGCRPSETPRPVPAVATVPAPAGTPSAAPTSRPDESGAPVEPLPAPPPATSASEADPAPGPAPHGSSPSDASGAALAGLVHGCWRDNEGANAGQRGISAGVDVFVGPPRRVIVSPGARALRGFTACVVMRAAETPLVPAADGYVRVKVALPSAP